MAMEYVTKSKVALKEVAGKLSAGDSVNNEILIIGFEN